jgi:hypothetical protein
LVCLSRPVVVGGSLADRLGLEQLTDIAPGGPTPPQPCRGHRGVRPVARTTGRRQDQTARRRRDRSADQSILDHHHVARYLKVSRIVREQHLYKQTRRGRPGPNTAYRKLTKRRFDIAWTIDEATIAYDDVSDGMYPLITNDRTLSPAQVLEAHKGQPMIEKRSEQFETVHEIAPVFLKNEGRIEALFTLYFLALLVQAPIERELRLAMKRNNIEHLPLYPEQRHCAHPTTEQILRLFSLAARNKLVQNSKARVMTKTDAGMWTCAVWCVGQRPPCTLASKPGIASKRVLALRTCADTAPILQPAPRSTGPKQGYFKVNRKRAVRTRLVFPNCARFSQL